MKKVLVLFLAVIMATAFCVPAFAGEGETKEGYPVIGSWKLDKVFETAQSEEPVLMKKDEAQSLYGSGITILTFDEDGYAHEITFEGEDMVDLAAQWKSLAPNEYIFTDEDGIELTFRYDEKGDVLHRYFLDSAPDASYHELDFVYARAFVGSWQLKEVIQVHEGDAPTELPKEENQSLYGDSETIYTFLSDGTGCTRFKEAGEDIVTEGTWKMPQPDKFVYTENETGMELNYFRVDDTLYRDFKEQEGASDYLRFIYGRVEVEEEPAKQEETTAAAQEKPAEPAAAAAPAQEDELIADGQIFTGYEMVLYDADTGDAVLVKELNQGGWANDKTGVIYEQEGGGGDHFYGNDGSVLVTEWYYYTIILGETGEDELIADGQIFTGFERELYDPDTGEKVVVKELNQGGWADETTGVVYEEGVDNADFFYGSDGSVLVTGWYYSAVILEEGREDELIADGQIFSGYEMYLYDEYTGEPVLVKELNQGGWVDDMTGVIYEQEGGGGDHFYGNDGSVLVSEWYYYEYIAE